MDPQKSAKPEPWVMDQGPPQQLLCSEASELGLCAGNELRINNCLPVSWFRHSLCKHNSYLRAAATSRGGWGSAGLCQGLCQGSVKCDIFIPSECSSLAPSPGLCPRAGKGKHRDDGCWVPQLSFRAQS